MLIDSTCIKGLNHLISEVVDSCIDEALTDFCIDVSENILPDSALESVTTEMEHNMMSKSQDVDSFIGDPPCHTLSLERSLCKYGIIDLFAGIGGIAIGSDELKDRSILLAALFSMNNVTFAITPPVNYEFMSGRRACSIFFCYDINNKIQYFTARPSSGGLPYRAMIFITVSFIITYRILSLLLIPKILSASDKSVASNMMAA